MSRPHPENSRGSRDDGRDPFGIRKLFPTAGGGPVWDSTHWFNGRRRSIAVRARDPADPTGISEARGSGAITIDGDGMLVLSGHQPRIYLCSPNTHFFRNVEMTVYYRRVADDGAPWAGLVMAARSGPNGHTVEEACDAHTYYARLRHDGRKDFAKELEHPKCTVRGQGPAWEDTRLPYDRWIGMKLLVYNVDDDRHVRLEQYRDLTGGADGGTWKKINETTDTGGWSPPSRCGFPADFIPTVGGGVCFIRNTAVREAHYKWFTVREIAPTPPHKTD